MQLADDVGEDKGEEGDDEGGAEDVDAADSFVWRCGGGVGAGGLAAGGDCTPEGGSG